MTPWAAARLSGCDMYMPFGLPGYLGDQVVAATREKKVGTDRCHGRDDLIEAGAERAARSWSKSSPWPVLTGRG